jgi:hypothetical protein
LQVNGDAGEKAQWRVKELIRGWEWPQLTRGT